MVIYSLWLAGDDVFAFRFIWVKVGCDIFQLLDVQKTVSMQKVTTQSKQCGFGGNVTRER